MDYATARATWRYDPETGILYWLAPRPKVPPSLVAGAVNEERRIIVGYRGKRYYAHRLAWLLVTGEMPQDMVDHINGDPSDNRWCNLRAANNVENQANQKRMPKGVKVDKWGRFEAQLRYKGRRIYLGRYAGEADATHVYRAAHRVLHGAHSCFSPAG